MWLETPLGIADMRRFYGMNAKKIDKYDITAYDIACYYSYLPIESATMIKASDTSVSFDTLLLAHILDAIRALSIGLGGKKMKDDDLIAPQLMDNSRHDTMKQELLNMLRMDRNKNINKK